MNKFSIPASMVARPINITLVGAGGNGSATLKNLFQMDYLLRKLSDDSVYLNVTVYDDDTVSHTNLGRQGFWPIDLGQFKSDVLVSRYNTHGLLNWKSKTLRFDSSSLFSNALPDILITCVDKASVRVELGQALASSNRTSDMLWLDLGNDKNAGNIILGHAFNRENKLPNVFDLYPQLVDVEDIEEDSCSHFEAMQRQTFGVNDKMAIEATCLLWKLLREGAIDYHGAYVDLEQATVKPLKINSLNWAILGYAAA